ncbi:LytTR family DNA-binding domain-containing protein [uncultured Polaribacter sp.]|uniref:LytR/AlgR family response regulator transcription factor n=1 Tax=uncultured Polaribacter sp. TaxID=174711 RepID=UPI002605A379|nr:LytTR family DNA-binding domain-containing protein [uncultured Polaribacter sp.]
MTCIFIDDEKTSRFILQNLCEKVGNLEVIGQFSNAMDALKFLNKNSVDLIFLDIHMPGFSGFDFIETLNLPPKIILTTSDRNFAIEAFEYESVIDYLVKPLQLDRLKKTLKKIKAPEPIQVKTPIVESVEIKDNKNKNHLYINIDRRLIKININAIQSIKALGDYILLKTDDTEYKVHNTLKSIHIKLPDSLFLKVHRSHIINTSKIIDIEDNSVLIGKDIIPVSRSNRPELIRRLNLL